MDYTIPAQKSGLYPLTTPILPDFEWVNQGTSTATENSSGISLSVNWGDARRLVRGLISTVAISGDDRYYEVCVLPPMFDLQNTTDDCVGLIIEDEGGPDIGYHLFGVAKRVVATLPTLALALYNLSDPGSGNAAASLIDVLWVPHAGPIWLRCEADVTGADTATFSYSFDGQEFMTTTELTISTADYSFGLGGVGAYTDNLLKATMVSFKSGAL
jgi:hypothetical protein